MIVGDQVVAMTASWGDRMWEVYVCSLAIQSSSSTPCTYQLNLIGFDWFISLLLLMLSLISCY